MYEKSKGMSKSSGSMPKMKMDNKSSKGGAMPKMKFATEKSGKSAHCSGKMS